MIGWKRILYLDWQFQGSELASVLILYSNLMNLGNSWKGISFFFLFWSIYCIWWHVRSNPITSTSGFIWYSQEWKAKPTQKNFNTEHQDRRSDAKQPRKINHSAGMLPYMELILSDFHARFLIKTTLQQGICIIEP